MKVLVVDDDSTLRHVINLALGNAGISVSEAENGEDALERLAADTPDLVILDIIMPKMDGLEALLQIKKEYPDIVVIAMSGGGRARHFEPLELAFEAGAATVLRKPFQIHDLVQLVQHLGEGKPIHEAVDSVNPPV